MSHVHLFTPAQSVTFDTTADVTAGRLVELTGPRRVGPAAAGSLKVVGAAANDVKSGDDVLVIRKGIQNLTSASAINAGDRISAATAGKVATVANGVAGIGLALTSATGADQAIQIALD